MIDSLICAEIPDKVKNKKLFDVVTNCMIHGPCGVLNPSAICMENGSCTKQFPKDFQKTTIENANGYPFYKRSENGAFVEKNGMKLDNRFVVPYNPFLSTKYNAHINVEVCSTVKSVKYLYKYVSKGHDCASIEISETSKYDDIKSHLNTRFVSSPEAMWKLFKFKMSNMSHTIIRLAIHLEFQQQVYFVEGNERSAVEKAANNHTTLTAWFELNKIDHEARQLLYQEIPLH